MAQRSKTYRRFNQKLKHWIQRNGLMCQCYFCVGDEEWREKREGRVEKHPKRELEKALA